MVALIASAARATRRVSIERIEVIGTRQGSQERLAVGIDTPSFTL
jgi:hypothetical protein